MPTKKPKTTPNPEANAFGTSDEYWATLSEFSKDLYRLLRPMPHVCYAVGIHLNHLERTLEGFKKDNEACGGSFEMCPDFQRGHVWTQEKQIAYIEAMLRGIAPVVIRFNCPNWQGGDAPSDIGSFNMVCVDGLQRVNACLAFIRGEFKILNGTYGVRDLDNTPFTFARPAFALTFQVHSINNRKDLLQFYLDLNSGGVVHSEEELARVAGLLKEVA